MFFRRAISAHQNGMENFPAFASAILASYAAKVSPAQVNGIAGSYVLSRAFYNYIYINGDSAEKSNTRSTTWAVGTGGLLYLFVAAAFKVKL